MLQVHRALAPVSCGQYGFPLKAGPTLRPHSQEGYVALLAAAPHAIVMPEETLRWVGFEKKYARRTAR